MREIRFCFFLLDSDYWILSLYFMPSAVLFWELEFRVLPAVSCQLLAGLEFVLPFHVQGELICVFPCGDPERTLALDTG